MSKANDETKLIRTVMDEATNNRLDLEDAKEDVGEMTGKQLILSFRVLWIVSY